MKLPNIHLPGGAHKRLGSEEMETKKNGKPKQYSPSDQMKEVLNRADKPQVNDPAEAVKKGELTALDAIAPNTIEVDFDYIKIGDVYMRTLFVTGYPRFVAPGWMEPVINYNHSLDLSFYIYPVEGKSVLDELRRKITEMEAEVSTDLQRGRIVNPSTAAKLEDAKVLQDQLVKGSERFFEFAFYVTVPAASIEDLNNITRRVEATLGALLIEAKSSTLDMRNGLNSAVVLGKDKLSITRNMDTTSLATTFPFTSAELSSDTGVLYGINLQNDSFIIFDRFQLENSNMVVFATSGAGKSFTVKLESVRSMMLGAEVIIIDPENEYRALSDAVGGEYIEFSFDSPSKINPFDLSQIYEEGENHLGLKVLTLHSLFKIIMGKMTATQEAILDRAIINAYRAKGITVEPSTQKNESPLIEDLYKALIGMETDDALDLAARIEKYVRGSFAGIFDQQTNIDITNPFTVFSVRDVQDTLRPIAMFIILDYIWTKIKGDIKKRLLVVDEAWHMMRYEDSAQFMWSIVKRARKYYLGLTTISQDVEDFLSHDIGKAVVTNSSLRLLLKQSPAAINKITEVFYLSQGERQLLLAADIGEGIIFAGPHHAPIRVVASPEEYQFITTRPQDVFGVQSRSRSATGGAKVQSSRPSPRVVEKAK